MDLVRIRNSKIVVFFLLLFAFLPVDAKNNEQIGLSLGTFSQGGLYSFNNNRACVVLFAEDTIVIEPAKGIEVFVYTNNDGYGHDLHTYKSWSSSKVIFDKYEQFAFVILKKTNGDKISLDEINDLALISINNSPKYPTLKSHKDSLILNLSSLSNEFSSYKLFPDGKSDCSIALNKLLMSKGVRQAMRTKVLVLVFDTTDIGDTYLFKNGISYTGMGYEDIVLRINANMKFNYSKLRLPTYDDILNDVPINTVDCLNFYHVNTLIVSSNIHSRSVIDCGSNSILLNNNYYEGITSRSGARYYSSFYHNGVSVTDCSSVEIRDIIITNAITNCINIGRVSNVFVGEVDVTNVIGDNGITIGGGRELMRKCSEPNSVLVQNSRITKCADLGLSIQTNKATVSNCIIEYCGNSLSPKSSNYGVNYSFNCGGGISCEGGLYGYRDCDVKITNSVIASCNNYALFTDIPGVLITDCRIDSISTNWKKKWLKLCKNNDFKYNALKLRQSGIIMTSGNRSADYVMVDHCTITNCKNLIGAIPTLPKITYEHCSFSNMQPDKSYYLKSSCVVYNCILDDTCSSFSDSYELK